MTARTVPRIGFFIPSGVGIGYTGPGVFLKRLLGPLSDTIDARVYAGERPGHETDPQLVPVRSMRVGNSGPLRQLAWALTAAWWVLIDRRQLDAVHFHGTYLYKILPALACAFFRIPYVLVPLASNADFSLSGKSSRIPGVRQLLRFIARRAAGGFALGDDVADELRRGGVPQQHVHVIMNPVSTEFFGHSGNDRFERHTLLFVGVVGKRKRPLLVLEALRLLKKDGINCRAIFLGPFADAAYGEAFESAAAELGVEEQIEHIEFSDDVSGFMLNHGSVFVLLSETEGIPGALVEAMAAGLPCVVTDAGAMRGIVNSSGAGSVVSADGEDAASAILSLLSNESTWQSCSSSARAYAETHFKAESIAAMYYEQLQVAMAGGAQAIL